MLANAFIQSLPIRADHPARQQAGSYDGHHTGMTTDNHPNSKKRDDGYLTEIKVYQQIISRSLIAKLVRPLHRPVDTMPR